MVSGNKSINKTQDRHLIEFIGKGGIVEERVIAARYLSTVTNVDEKRHLSVSLVASRR